MNAPNVIEKGRAVDVGSGVLLGSSSSTEAVLRLRNLLDSEVLSRGAIWWAAFDFAPKGEFVRVWIYFPYGGTSELKFVYETLKAVRPFEMGAGELFLVFAYFLKSKIRSLCFVKKRGDDIIHGFSLLAQR